MPGDTKQIFYDSTRTRWRRLAAAALLAGCTAVLLVLGFMEGLDRDASLPDLHLPSPRTILRPLPNGDTPTTKTFGSLLPPRRITEGTLERRFPRRVFLPNRPLRLAFYVSWDDASLTSLRQNASRLDGVIPEWLHLADDSGTLELPAPGQIRSVREALPERGVQLLPLVNNYDSVSSRWGSARMERILLRPKNREKLLNELTAFADSDPYGGICLDFESLTPGAARAYPNFLRQLGELLHARGKILLVCVPMAAEDLNYSALAASCDLLVLMAYDEHWSGSDPGPVASDIWFRSAVASRLGTLPGYKVVLALGEYGYDWCPENRSVRELTFQDSLATARESEGHPSFVGKTRNPGYSYEDETGKTHRVWYLDAATSWNQIRETFPLRPGGYALWRLGSEDPSFWALFASDIFPGQLPREGLERLRYGYDLDYEGRGEVLRVGSLPREGHRTFQVDRDGSIRDEHIRSFPCPFEMDRWGYRKGLVILSFDDGPDPKFTPAILDILRREKVPAVFFVIGANANLHPELVQRELAEGHEVGNHTFRHPDVSRIGPATLRLELNATQRLLEARCGVQTLLFRPPYGEDIEPVRPDQIRPVMEATRRGYLTVGMGIDPSDWMHPGTDAIIRSALGQLAAGRGSVILLHDGGGDRSQTVAALPELIREIRRRGYRFASLSELIGLPSGSLNPPVTGAERLQAFLTEGFFDALEWIFKGVSAIFLAGLVLGILRALLIGTLAILQARIRKREIRRSPAGSGPLPSVSVLVPCYNEAKVIGQSLRQVLASDHPQFEILLVDDGSTDGTTEAATEEIPPGAPVRILRQSNRGKASALNRGLMEARFDVVLVVDADTNLEPQTLRMLARRFRDPRVGAAAGNAKVGNRHNLLTRWQALEYVASQNLERRAYDLLNGILVVPGAVGAWRRELLLSLGGFPDRTLAEDADMTLEVLRAGRRIVYEEEARGWTEVPESPRSFLKQRFRWSYGTLQVLWHHRGALFDPRLGTLGWIALPDAWISKILLPLLAPLGDLYALGILIRAVWTHFEHPLEGTAPFVPVETVLLYLAFFILVETAVSAVAILLEPQEDPLLLPWIGLQHFYYRQLLYWISAKSLLTALKGVGAGWNKLDRTGGALLPREFADPSHPNLSGKPR